MLILIGRGLDLKERKEARNWKKKREAEKRDGSERKRVRAEAGESGWERKSREGNGKQRSKVAGQDLLDCVVFNVRKDAEVKGRIRS